MRTRLVVGLIVLSISCVATPLRVEMGNTIVLADDQSQALFDSALVWSRIHGLETGGCFRIFAVSGNKVIVSDAVERVVWRRADRVMLGCTEGQGIWHTHWLPEGATSVGCNVSRAMDLILIGPNRSLGLVVCGLGRDSVIPYNYSAKADSNYKASVARDPEIRAGEDSLRKEIEGFRCENEPEESLKRPSVYCKEYYIVPRRD